MTLPSRITTQRQFESILQFLKVSLFPIFLLFTSCMVSQPLPSSLTNSPAQSSGTAGGGLSSGGSGNPPVSGGGNGSGGGGSPIVPISSQSPSGGNSGKYKNLVWSDEFEGAAGSPIDYTKWNLAPGCDGGANNNEWECYTASTDNIHLDGKSHLVLKLLQQSHTKGGFTSGRVNTAGKTDWLYGRFEGKMMILSGKGYWPAFWMMPTGNAYGIWPNSGEIDIMEVIGNDPSTQNGTLHYGGYDPVAKNFLQVGGTYAKSGDLSQDYHIYAMERDINEIRFYIDDTLFYTARDTDKDFWTNTPWANTTAYDKTKWPFTQRFYIILNLAIGGNWPGDPDPNINGGEFLIDYIRVFQ